MKTIGIDIGTTSISAAVYDTDADVVIQAESVPNDAFINTDMEWERIQDPEKVINSAVLLLEKLVRDHTDIAAIGLTGQMHGILYTGPRGEAVSPLYTWQDGRGNIPLADGKTMTERIRERTGLFTASGYGLVTHLVLEKMENADHTPEIPALHSPRTEPESPTLYSEKAGSGNSISGNTAHDPGQTAEKCSLCTIGDYLGMVLTGRMRPLVHISNAASLGFYDTVTNSFRADALETMGMNLDLLPEVTDAFTVLGRWNGIPVTVAVGDNQASFLGTVGIEDGVALLNMGTGG